MYVICIYPMRNLYANFAAIREGTAEHYCVQFGSNRKFPCFDVYFQSPIFWEGRGAQPLKITATGRALHGRKIICWMWGPYSRKFCTSGHNSKILVQNLQFADFLPRLHQNWLAFPPNLVPSFSPFITDKKYLLFVCR